MKILKRNKLTIKKVLHKKKDSSKTGNFSQRSTPIKNLGLLVQKLLTDEETTRLIQKSNELTPEILVKQSLSGQNQGIHE